MNSSSSGKGRFLDVEDDTFSCKGPELKKKKRDETLFWGRGIETNSKNLQDGSWRPFFVRLTYKHNRKRRFFCFLFFLFCFVLFS